MNTNEYNKLYSKSATIVIRNTRVGSLYYITEIKENKKKPTHVFRMQLWQQVT